MALVTRVQEWILRRVETIDLLDDLVVRRRVSVDFDVRRVVPAGTTVAPLAVLAKEPLRNFDLRDESGAAVPLLTSAENGALAARLLTLRAAEVLGRPPPPDVVEDFVMLATRAPADGSEAAVERLHERSGPSSAARAELVRDDTLASLVETLARGFLLLVPAGDARRRILKLSYDEPLGRLGGGVVDRVLASLAWTPIGVDIEAASVGEGRAYHFEMRAPAGLAVRASRLVVLERPRHAIEVHDAAPTSETHLYVGAPAPTYRGIVTVWLEPLARELVFSSLALAVVNALVLTFAAVRLEELGRAPTAALLLVLPGLAFALFARQGEHPVARRLSTGVRLTVLASAVVALAGALFLVAGYPRETLWTLWRVVLGLGWAAAVILSLSYTGVEPLARRRTGA